MEDDIKEIMAEILDVDSADINENFGPENTDNWDSLSNLRLISALEERFSIKLTMQEIGTMTDFHQIKKVVSGKAK